LPSIVIRPCPIVEAAGELDDVLSRAIGANYGGDLTRWARGRNREGRALGARVGERRLESNPSSERAGAGTGDGGSATLGRSERN
jgi:hypothetical protein